MDTKAELEVEDVKDPKDHMEDKTDQTNAKKKPFAFDLSDLPEEVRPMHPLREGAKSYTTTPLEGQTSMQVLLFKKGFQINNVIEVPNGLEECINRQGNVLVSWKDDINVAWTIAKAIILHSNLIKDEKALGC